MRTKELTKKLKMAVEALIASENGCSTIKLDDRLSICVGWSEGVDINNDVLIHSKTEPNFCLMAGFKVWTSDDLRTDYDWINFPYLKSGEVLEVEINIRVNEDYEKLAIWLLNEYEILKNSYEIVSNNGLTIEKVRTKIEKNKNKGEKKMTKKGKRILKVGESIVSISTSNHAFFTTVEEVYINAKGNDFIIRDSDDDLITADSFGWNTFYSIEEAEKICGKIKVD